MTFGMRVGTNLVALAIIVSAGITQGLWSGRWSGSDALERRASEIARIPIAVGEWKGQDLPLDRRTQEAAGIEGYVIRRYVNRRGEGVTALLVCGRPGPISAHTPEVCYPGAGFEETAPKVRLPVGVGSNPDEFWAADFGHEEAASQTNLRIFYSWSTDGTWMASESPRMGFAGEPVLYKLYVIREMGSKKEQPRDDPTIGFLGQFLPEVRSALFPRP
jgi:Protein of unknown function (DUF3485)